MSEDNFLSRWSRRKREADAAKAVPQAETEPKAESKTASVSGSDQRETEPDFDPATLPPIESITAMSDVTAFLRAGVPAELTRAALRRVWTADPAIRDFVGLAENAWDFTDPTAMPGFGPLESTDDVRRMIAQVVDRVGEIAKQEAEAAPPNQVSLNDSKAVDEGDRDDAATPAVDQRPQNSPKTPAAEVLSHRNKEDVAMQDGTPGTTERPRLLARKSHGGALPE